MNDITVMIVDDSEMIRQRLERWLGCVAGVRVVAQADDVPHAIAAFDALHPSVVILDISMPGGSGIDVLTHIKHNAPETVVIVLTNYALGQLRQRCISEGADFFHDKSTEFDRAIAVLRRLATDSVCPMQPGNGPAVPCGDPMNDPASIEASRHDALARNATARDAVSREDSQPSSSSHT